MTFLKQHFDTEGPLGIPMKDAQAKALDELLRHNPEAEYQRSVVEKATSEISPGERADVSWISTESVDRDKEIVLAGGMDDSHFQHNPIVTLCHNYWMPPVGKSLWRRKVKAGGVRGIKAKTVYPERPEDWPGPEWEPDAAYALVKSGLMNGKSIGFLSLDSSPPTPEEVVKNPELATVRRIIRKWLLLEYACTWMPCNGEALTTEVGKSQVQIPDAMLTAMGLDPAVVKNLKTQPEAPQIVFTPIEEYERRIQKEVSKIDVQTLTRRAVQDALDKLRGRV
jgi:hypothetical protein